MRDVIGSTARRPASRESPQDEHERRVEERHYQDQHCEHRWADERDPRVEDGNE